MRCTPRELGEARFLWHPTQIDNGSFSVVDAAHLRIPALSSDYPAMHEIDDQFGLGLAWSPSDDPRRMASALKWMEDNVEERRSLLPSRRGPREAQRERVCRPVLVRGARMPVKIFGIYLAYAPTINLQYQGLGRYLAYFLKAAANRSDVRFVVACPSWTREDLLKLCESEGVASTTFDIISLPGKPVLLQMYQRYLQYKRRPLPPRPACQMETGHLSRGARSIGC